MTSSPPEMWARDDWVAELRPRTDLTPGPTLQLVLQPAGTSWASPVLGSCSDGQQYFIKTMEGCPRNPGLALTTEFIVGRVGRLIGAPVCENAIVRIPDDLDGEVVGSLTLRAGIAHGSVLIPDALLVRRTLTHRYSDDNPRRHVGIIALDDLCCGSDRQWLTVKSSEHSYYSHDHGMFFPPSGHADWSVHEMLEMAHEKWPSGQRPEGLDPAEVAAMAARISAVRVDELLTILNAVPHSWGCTDLQLGTVGWFLWRRLPAVAKRLLDLKVKG